MTARSTNSVDTSRIRTRYDRVARLYDWLDAGFERWLYARWRQRLWALARGPRVLEIGVGTGKNIAYYPRGTAVAAVDFSAAMMAHARQRAAAGNALTFSRMDAQSLAFADAVFDTVAATFVFGSLPDPVRGLREAARVMQPDGRLLLLEFVRPPGLFGWVIDLLNPLFRAIYGAEINRPTLDHVIQAGFAIEHVESFCWGAVVLIVARR